MSIFISKGRLNDGEVREFIQSNSLAVEIHDRDGKEDETPGSFDLNYLYWVYPRYKYYAIVYILQIHFSLKQ